MRKDSELEITDHIKVYFAGSEKLQSIIEKNPDALKTAVLADELHFDTMAGKTADWNINGEKTTIGIEKA